MVVTRSAVPIEGTSTLAQGFAATAWHVAGVIAVLLLLLLVQILVLRLLHAIRRRREARFRATWETLLAQCVEAVPVTPPIVERRNVPLFLMMWNHLQESLRDDVTARLNQLARRARVDDEAIHLLRRGGLRDRLIATTALGHLGDSREWDRLLGLAQSEDGIVSLAAARALMRIDPTRAAPTVIGWLANRSDWPAAAVAAMLAEAGPDAISVPLVAAVEAAGPEHAPRLIRLLEFTHADLAGPIIRRTIDRENSIEIVIACLRVAADPELLDSIRTLLTDPRWPVRLHAAQALGRLGTAQDESLLVAALSDPQWWVRYRAAQSLASLPQISIDHVERLATALDDPFARDILKQVLAEKELAC